MANVHLGSRMDRVLEVVTGCIPVNLDTVGMSTMYICVRLNNFKLTVYFKFKT